MPASLHKNILKLSCYIPRMQDSPKHVRLKEVHRKEQDWGHVSDEGFISDVRLQEVNSKEQDWGLNDEGFISGVPAAW